MDIQPQEQSWSLYGTIATSTASRTYIWHWHVQLICFTQTSRIAFASLYPTILIYVHICTRIHGKQVAPSQPYILYASHTLHFYCEVRQLHNRTRTSGTAPSRWPPIENASYCQVAAHPTTQHNDDFTFWRPSQALLRSSRAPGSDIVTNRASCSLSRLDVAPAFLLKKNDFQSVNVHMKPTTCDAWLLFITDLLYDFLVRLHLIHLLVSDSFQPYSQSLVLHFLGRRYTLQTGFTSSYIELNYPSLFSYSNNYSSVHQFVSSGTCSPEESGGFWWDHTQRCDISYDKLAKG